MSEYSFYSSAYGTTQHSPDPQGARVQVASLSKVEHSAKYFCGEASVDACFSGDRSVELVVPQIVRSPDDIFAEASHLWREGFDTVDIAAITNISEGHAYRLINEYYAKKYSLGWGSRHDAGAGA
jgi:hypothetical protein